jgi:hypothetical protein
MGREWLKPKYSGIYAKTSDAPPAFGGAFLLGEKGRGGARRGVWRGCVREVKKRAVSNTSPH